ncbi:hypothetical protein Nmel_006591 [Mimus melanotis]
MGRTKSASGTGENGLSILEQGLGWERAPLSCCRSCWQAAFRNVSRNSAVNPWSCSMHSTGAEQALHSPSPPSHTPAVSWEGGSKLPEPYTPCAPQLPDLAGSEGSHCFLRRSSPPG